jgi:hypothetical protein
VRQLRGQLEAAGSPETKKNLGESTHENEKHSGKNMDQKRGYNYVVMKTIQRIDSNKGWGEAYG